MNSDLRRPLGGSSSSAAIYLHIPFCTQKCSYCDFYSVAASDSAVVNRVLTSTLDELRWYLDELKPQSITTIYIGGGTPSAIPRDTLGKFLEHIAIDIGTDVQEFTIEANPESIDDEFLQIAIANGVSRISVGIQSMSPTPFSYLDRPGTITDNTAALALIHQYPEIDINLDLISGIPGSNAETLQHDLRIVAETHPSHVSWYSLTIEPNTPLQERIARYAVEPLGPEVADAQWLAGQAMLEALGYERYEIANFCLPGKRCLHNLGYWKMAPYIGCGPGATSTVPDSDGHAVRIEHERSLSGFLEKPHNGASFEVLSASDFAKEVVMMGLRTIDGIDEERFTSIFSYGFRNTIPNTLDHWNRLGYIYSTDSSTALTGEGLSLLDRFLVQAFGELDGHSWDDYHWSS